MGINTKGKRKIVVDKKFNKAFPLLDTEAAVTPEYISKILRVIEK